MSTFMFVLSSTVLPLIAWFFTVAIPSITLGGPKRRMVTFAALALAVAYFTLPLFPEAAAESTHNNPHRAMVSKPQAFLSMRFFTGPQGVSEGVDRSDACRTFHVFGHLWEQTGETDALACATGFPVTITATVGVTPTVEITTTPPITTTETVVVTPTAPTVHPTQPPTTTPTPPITTTETPIVETPTLEPTLPPVTETPIVVTSTPVPGNPGNDKPVGQTEHCELGMCENDGGQDGEHGNSHIDNGHGNHDH